MVLWYALALLLFLSPQGRKLTQVWCDDWSLRLLRRAAQQLVSLHLVALRQEHLELLHSLPRLRRLEVDNR